MGSHILDILRQGIWASLTGGWFYDPQQQVFCNTFHLYLWVILLTFPLAIYSATDPSVLIWTVYCGFIGILFTVIKVINYRLHHLFDTGESEEEKPSETANSDASAEKQGESKGDGDGVDENIEMSNLGKPSAEEQTVNISHVNLQLESDKGDGEETLPTNHSSKKSGKAPLAEVEGGDDVTSGAAKLSKQLNSSANEEEEDSPDGDEDVPRTITTTVDIEHTPKVSSNVGMVEDQLPNQQFAMDPLGVGVFKGMSEENGSHSDSPSCGKQVKKVKTSDDECNSTEEEDGIIKAEKASEEKEQASDEWKPKMRMRRERRAVRRSKSSQEWNKPKPNPARREKLSSQSLNMPASPRPRLPTLNHSTSSNSDWSDASFGEVEIPDASSCTDEVDNMYLALNEKAVMSSSVGESSGSTLVATSSSHSQFGRPESPVFLPLNINQPITSSAPARNYKKDSSQPPPFVRSMWSHNQGDPDTDSLTSGGDSASHSTDTSSSVNLDPSIVCLKVKDLDLTTPSSPSAEDLDLMRSQGAIPKKGKVNGQNGNPKESTSPGSTDLSDPEEIRRRLIEILWDPQHSEELRQLQQFVKLKKSRSNDPELSTKDSSTLGDKSEALKLKRDEESSEKSTHHLSTHEEERKSTTPTEFSALLPVNPQLIRATNRRARRRRARPQHVQAEVLNCIVGEDGHLATSHDDTTDGAVHWFQDEQGNWMSYTFGENSSGAANNVPDMNTNATVSSGDSRKHFEHDSLFRSGSLPSIASNSTVVIEEQLNADPSSQADLEWELTSGMSRFQLHEDTLQSYFQALLRRNQTSNSSTDSDAPHGNAHKGPKSKHFYKFWLWPVKNFVKIRFDRLALLAALDRNISVIENIVSVLLAMCVGALGALMISSNFYHDLCLLLFCFIMAGCQYSLLKSVQPDAASPMHGYNRIIVFSRPFYFCVCCSVVLLLDLGTQSEHEDPIYLYGVPFTITSALTSIRNLLTIFILCFPLLFTLGLLPQVNTFLMYLLEQIDMHVFGGNATTSLLSSFYCVCRSCLSVILMYGFAYAALKNMGNAADKCKGDMDDAAQTVAMSILCGIIVSVSYHLSRSAADPAVLWMLVRDLVVESKAKNKETEETSAETTTELVDPLPEKLKSCLKQRLQSDVIVCIVVAILVFAVHVSTAFTSPALQPVLSDVLYLVAACFGFLVHYIIPHLRKEMPWLCCSHPIIRSKEWMDFEVRDAPKVMCIERVYLALRFVERNMIYPVICMCAATTSTPTIVCKFGEFGGPLIMLICSMKLLRSAFSDSPRQYLIIAFTYLFFKFDFQWSSETFLIDYFFVSIMFCKFCDFLLKLNFIITYIAPWQITWGSAFHAVAQPLSVPHSAMLFLQASMSAIFSTPLSPFLGSAIFMTSYVRPVKFWERDYNTRRVDHTNTRLASQLERNPGADDNNLNSIFYEHLTRSLQHSLCGDLLLGRWGNYTQGDCFIMASDYLNALVHIIEVGNGLVTFQLRGLEFRGTYCQQREVEAITEGIDDNQRCCCFERGHLPHCLSLKAAFSQRWLAWEVVVAKYILEGYSITDNSAATILQVFELRKALITYYIKSIIYYTVRAPNLENWLNNATVKQALEGMEKDSYVDLDPTFNYHIDEDYDARLKCISRSSFCQTYLRWIQCCAHRRDKSVECSKSSKLVSLCFALSLMGRRALSAASQNSARDGDCVVCYLYLHLSHSPTSILRPHQKYMMNVDLFLYGLHALFKGDFRIQSPKDEWVFADMDMIRRVVAPAVRMSLKLHQDHFQCPDEYMDPKLLYQAITEHERTMVIAHEADPAWRNAVLSNVPSLLALRHVFDEGTDEYKIIMLNKRYLNFRIVKVNRECVRGLWAGQQQELIFLRNRNPERGSIQNAKQALRNMINSSCDQPIGYPIYVSPLTASFATTHDQLSRIPGLGAEFRFSAVRSFFTTIWNRIRSHCDATCAGGSASFDHDLPYSVSHQVAAATIGSTPRQGLTGQPIDIPLQPLGNRGSLISTASSASKINTLASLANLISDSTVKDNWPHRVRIVDPSQVYESINHGRRNLEVQWPSEDWRKAGGKNGWQGWTPKKGMEGTVVHRWSPGHPDPAKRSHVDKTIVLIQVKDHYVPIAETGVFDLGAEV